MRKLEYLYKPEVSDGLDQHRDTTYLSKDASLFVDRTSNTHVASTYTNDIERENYDLVQVNKALLESRNRYRELYNHSPAGYATIDSAGTILECNLAFAELPGIEKNLLLSQRMGNFVLATDQNIFHLHCQSPGANNHQSKCEFRLHHTDGRTIWIEMESQLQPGLHAGRAVYWSVATDITLAKRYEEKLYKAATRDSLTGLHNRSAFEQHLTNILEPVASTTGNRLSQSTNQHSLCFIDMDRFKLVNDTAGHHGGDELIKRFSSLLASLVRQDDFVARVGGDEFAVILKHCSAEQAVIVAEKIRAAIEAMRFVWDGKVFRTSTSIGIASIDHKCSTIEDLVICADMACYAAKEQGRNRISLYDETNSFFTKIQSEAQRVTTLNHALDEDRFELWCQPIVPVESEPTEKHNSGEGARFEILLRLIDTDGNIVSAASFIPAAERFGLSCKIDRWVVKRVLKQIFSDSSVINKVECCFINLSGASLADPEFHQEILELLSAQPDICHRICFEITETAAISNMDSAMEFIQQTRDLGCQFALDDFGSGLSSFAYLQTLPVDFLKIDGQFVRDIVSNNVNQALVRAIHEVGTVMNKRSIAEFVEDEQVLEVLRSIGVDYAQGYGTGRPAPLKDHEIFAGCM